MDFAQIYKKNQFVLSFELFPPRTADGEKSLYANVERLVELRPQFLTCTYGAGGSTRDKTLEIVSQLKDRHALPVASHLTCVASTVGQLRAYLELSRARGVDNIVALRGDPPQGETTFRPLTGGLSYANELVSLIRSEFPSFGVAVAGYPETHQEALSTEVDLRNLQRKVQAGADVVITQLFFHNEDFYRFRDRCRELQIDVPIVPGLMPVSNLAQIQRITSMCGAKLPSTFVDRLSQRDDPDWQQRAGIEFAIEQTQDLIDHGVPGLHFYVLNKAQSTAAVLNGVQMPGRP